MDVSKYRHLSDEELIRHLTVPRAWSPIIDVLCDRIEALIYQPHIEVETPAAEPAVCKYCGAVQDGEDM
jgi:hypothetical protein